MPGNSIIWVLVNSKSRAEAEKIGKAILNQRLAACYGLYAKFGSTYFWPPGSKKLETSKGPLLVLETLPKHYRSILSNVRELHSDQVPFIGKLKIDDVNKDFYNWIRGEVK
jgi:periplasmic divalent cation tolerance protein